MRFVTLTCVLIAVAVSAFNAAADERFPDFDAVDLQQGRATWMETCRNCHATGFAGAPPVTSVSAWKPRIKKPREVLYSHAIEGFYGEDYAHMPPRGGNEALSDSEVKLAVDYMLALVNYFNPEGVSKNEP